MKLVCAPEGFDFPDECLPVILFGSAEQPEHGEIGAAILRLAKRNRLAPSPHAWDLLSLALGVTAADLASHRDRSPDGWTRDFELVVAVHDASFWNKHSDVIQSALAFLTTDRWLVRFVDGGFELEPDDEPTSLEQPSVVLLSGGLDSLVGAIDLSTAGNAPIAVSQLVRGDASNQVSFAAKIGGGLGHLQFNHNARVPDPEEPPTQRARSLLFIAYGVFIASALDAFKNGAEVIVHICENGFISINPPLTGARLGSLSTRTTHPVFLHHAQTLISAGLPQVTLRNPYQLRTKGEMLTGCSDQALLRDLAVESTSCGRYLRYGYKHCGRCMPCQIRRASFLAWGVQDTTEYVFTNLGFDDPEHAGFDDVRSAAMAIMEAREMGIDRWLADSLNTSVLGDVSSLREMVVRGLAELEALHSHYGVK